MSTLFGLHPLLVFALILLFSFVLATVLVRTVDGAIDWLDARRGQ